MPIKGEDMMRLERNDLRVIRWTCYNRPEDIISRKSIKQCLQDERLQWFGHPEKWRNVLGLIST